jgi:nicotinate-nucleotide adenylyltransferase
LKTSNNIKKTVEKIGLFGGTFDPIHLGHLLIADAVRESKGLHKVVFIPSARPPHKCNDIMFNTEERYRMLSLAVQDDPGFIVSDIEMIRNGFSFTIDTIREMKTAFQGNADISFIVGMDNLYDIDTWKDAQDIIRECRILVAKRVCDTCKEIPQWLRENIELVNVPIIEISSSDIRRRIREGRSIRYLVPHVIWNDIQNLVLMKKNLQGSKK